MIDYIFVSVSLLDQVSSSDIGPIQWSNHAPILANFRVPSKDKDSKIWRLNNLLLKDPLVTSVIDTELKEYFMVNNTCANKSDPHLFQRTEPLPSR